MTINGKYALSRRQCLAAATTALAVGLERTTGIAQENASIFAFSRSGRFTPSGIGPLLLGGMVVSKSHEQEIEATLEQRAQEISYGIALDYGTSRQHPIFLQQALGVLSAYPVSLVGATIDATGWNAGQEGGFASRREAESLFFSSVLPQASIELQTVRHARHHDDEIYAALEDRLGLLPTRFYPSHDESSRLFQIAATVLKCFGSLHANRSASGAKGQMIKEVLDHFGVDEMPASWRTSQLQIENVVVGR